MKSNTGNLEADTFYHIYNRGINGENIFKEERNYAFFLEKYIKYIYPIAHTYAYCLLKNHFHLLIRSRSEEEIKTAFPLREIDAGKLISLQFSHLFNSYAQSVNKSFERTGGLFETPFRRIEITNNAYLGNVLCYIHANPQIHGFVEDFRCYPHSSYGVYTSEKTTKLERDSGLGWFGDRNEFLRQHNFQNQKIDLGLGKFLIEF